MFSLQQTNAILCLLIGCPLNFILIWLILFKTSKSMRVWSWLLLQTSLIDSANLLSYFFMQPVSFSNGDNLGLYSDGPFGQCSIEIIAILYILFIYLGELSKYAIAGQFFYRWMIICRDLKFSPFLYAFANGLPILFAVLPAFAVFIIIDFSIPQNEATCPKCPTADRTILFSKSNESIESYVDTFIFLIGNFAAYSIILATSIQIWRKSRQSILPDQQHSREFSRQIGRVLLIQAVSPLILWLLPTFLIIFYIGAGWEIPEMVSFLAYQPWPSILAPMITILIIGQYRRQLAKLIFICKETTTTEVVPINIKCTIN